MDVVDIRIGLVCIFIGSDVEQEMASPYMDLWRAGPVGHVGL